MRILLSLFLVAFLSVNSALAQLPPKEVPPTFRVISASGSYTNLFYDIVVAGKTRPMALNLNQALSAPQLWPAKGQLLVYRLVPPPPGSPPEVKYTRQTIFNTTLPSDTSDCIVVTFPLSGNPLGPLLPRLVPASPATHKAGTVKVINFSTFDTAVGMDERSTSFKPGSFDVIPAGTGRVLFQVAVSKGNGWASAFRGERRLAPQVRGYIFVFNYMVDPDYGADATPPPATVKTFFEVSPEILAQKLTSSSKSQSMVSK